MKNFKQILESSSLTENSKAMKELKALVKGEKQAKKQKDKGDYVDFIYTKYEKEITKIEKKYNLGLDELGQMLMKL